MRKREAQRALAKAVDALWLSNSFLGVSIRSLKWRVDSREIDAERPPALLEEIAALKRVSRLLTRVLVLIDKADRRIHGKKTIR